MFLLQAYSGGEGKTEITARECFKPEEGVRGGPEEKGGSGDKYVHKAIAVLAGMAHRVPI